jgi:uncharacterized membrane protein
MRRSQISTLVGFTVFVFLSGSALYVGITNPGTDTNVTEFYMLNSEGKASNYPEELSLGESEELIVGVSNNTPVEQGYILKSSWGKSETRVSEIHLRPNNERELKLNLTAPEVPGTHQYYIRLYKKSSKSNHLVGELRLSVDVSRG